MYGPLAKQPAPPSIITITAMYKSYLINNTGRHKRALGSLCSYYSSWTCTEMCKLQLLWVWLPFLFVSFLDLLAPNFSLSSSTFLCRLCMSCAKTPRSSANSIWLYYTLTYPSIKPCLFWALPNKKENHGWFWLYHTLTLLLAFCFKRLLPMFLLLSSGCALP